MKKETENNVVEEIKVEKEKTVVTQETPVEKEEVVVKKQSKIVEAWKKLKTWEKIAVSGMAIVLVGAGGKYIYEAITKNPEVATDVIETITEDGINVVEF